MKATSRASTGASVSTDPADAAKAFGSTVGEIWTGRDDRYSELRSALQADTGSGQRRVEMHYIGG